MNNLDRLPYREIWAADFEFVARPGERPVPVCLVARELRTGKRFRLWQKELMSLSEPPYPIDDSSLFVAYFASAEMSCHLALGWPLPVRVFDCYTEFRNLTNGRPHRLGRGLLAAMAAYGLDSMSASEKTDMRDKIIAGGPWSESEQVDILDYCETDVESLERLLPRMLPDVLGKNPTQGLGQALLRGRYMSAVARMEHAGVPIDVDTLVLLRDGREGIQDQLIAEVDADYQVFDGRTFKQDRFAQWLNRKGIPWPRTDTDQLALDDDTFREMSRAYPEVAPLQHVRHDLARMRLNSLAVGADGRNRTLLSPFGASSGRNQPGNSKFIFGPSVWLRGLIKPAPEHGIAYIDFSSQEVAIAAALSGDTALMQAYKSGDVYLAFAKQAGLAPKHATKESHKEARDQCKAVVLGTQYGMGSYSLAQRIGKPEIYARRLLEAHRKAYPQFWKWSESAVDKAMLSGSLQTVFGWTRHAGDKANPRSFQNFPCQGNGAEMLRLAICMAVEAGLNIVAPIHDAVLLESPLDSLDDDIKQLQEIMAEASKIILNGFEVRTDVDVVKYPDRYMDPRGLDMWDKVMGLLEAENTCADMHVPTCVSVPSHVRSAPTRLY